MPIPTHETCAGSRRSYAVGLNVKKDLLYSRACRSSKSRIYSPKLFRSWPGSDQICPPCRLIRCPNTVCLIFRIERVSPSIETPGIPLVCMPVDFTRLFTLFSINGACRRSIFDFSLLRTDHDLDHLDHPALNVPLLWRICTVQLQPRK